MPEKSNSNLQNWTHDHIFVLGQDQKRAGELRTIIVIIITTSMMTIEITTSLVFGSMALLADDCIQPSNYGGNPWFNYQWRIGIYLGPRS